MNKYLEKKHYKNGEIISLLIEDLYRKYNYKNVLFVRTPTTGGWMDKLLKKEKIITRFLYDTKKAKIVDYHKSTIIVESEKLEAKINFLNKKFDLICIDPFHEYKESKRDFFYFSSLLSEQGILISHDCYPKKKSMTSSKFKLGSWCGQTYAALVKFAYKNKDLFYAVLNVDTGIGIISKQQINLFNNNLKNNLDREKQKQFLQLMNEKSKEMYSFYCVNSKQIINSIDVNSIDTIEQSVNL
jgi:hypothetical protein